MSASLAPECNDVKEKYDSCFLSWYSESYLRQQNAPSSSRARGSSASQPGVVVDQCAPLFASYKACLEKALKAQGLDKMIAEARDDVGREGDREYLRPVGRR